MSISLPEYLESTFTTDITGTVNIMKATCALKRVLTQIVCKKNGKKTKQNTSLLLCEKSCTNPISDVIPELANRHRLTLRRVFLGPTLCLPTSKKVQCQLYPSGAFSFFKKIQTSRSAESAGGRLDFFKNGSFILIYNQFGYPAVNIHSQRIRPSSVQPGKDMHPLSVHADIYGTKVEQTGQNSYDQKE